MAGAGKGGKNKNGSKKAGNKKKKLKKDVEKKGVEKQPVDTADDASDSIGIAAESAPSIEITSVSTLETLIAVVPTVGSSSPAVVPAALIPSGPSPN